MMPHATISKSEFNTRALEYLQLVEASSQKLIVTEHGRPVLEIHPYRPHESRPLDILRASVMRYDHPADPVEKEGWELPR
ncbi:type II toxin-antitoxin system Phd/YefM family antitoxin [Burkholderia cepacia]|uniref:type II toxin-antitoxin system Phd/YefM family antitoxin n=1 Tax=Burkholderia cepacia TaxID=292 RepID=UPI0009BC994B|nr:prevent-host-death protein [Burkholderia cepacia]MCA8348348.1 type II toxin-antitoxin system Phd/YefM family antitoxin [Burkholderia cepacia]MDN7894839.1 type II toxin-antitoxin system Phd/YefM family antitoxin [Burkholderia cepacia]